MIPKAENNVEKKSEGMNIEAGRKEYENPTGLMISKSELDKESSYSLLYLTSVYHDKLEEVEERIRLRWSRLTESTNQEENEKKMKHEMRDFGLHTNYDPDEEDVKKHDRCYSLKEPFVHSLLVAFVSAAFQLILTIVVIQYFWSKEIKTKSDSKSLDIAKIISFIIGIIIVWGEFNNGKKIVVHGFFQGELYRGTLKRIISIFFGFIQMIIALGCVFCNNQLMVSADNVSDTIRNFAAYLVLTNIDNFIGAYFLLTNNRLQKYIKSGVYQINVIKAKEYFSFSIVGSFLVLIYLGMVGYSFYCVLKSIGISITK